MLERGWKYYPALKLALPFAAGIVAARCAAPDVGIPLAALSLSLAWIATLLLLGRKGVALPLLIAVAAAGGLYGSVRSSRWGDGLAGEMVRDGEMIGRVAGDPVVRECRVEFPVEVDSLLYRNAVAHPRVAALVRLIDSSGFDPALLPRCGDRVSIAGDVEFPSGPINPGDIDYGALLRARGIDITLTLHRASTIDIISRDGRSLLDRIIDPIRRRARSFAATDVGGEEGDILRALLVGEREYVDPESRDAFMRTGTMHLLAVSGFNVALIAMALFAVLSWIPSRMVQFLLFAPLIGLYVLVAGGEPSLVRAAVMAVAFMAARVGSRISRPLNTLGFAALLILLITPDALFTAGFQLSFAAVAGIIVIYPPLNALLIGSTGRLRHRRLILLPARWLILSLSAQLFTLPFVLYHFGYLSMISPIINLPAAPLTSIALGAGVAGAVTGLVSSHAAAWFGGTAYLALMLVERIVGWGASLPMAGMEGAGIGLVAGGILLVGIIRLALSRAPAQMICRMLAVALLAGLLIATERRRDPLLAARRGLYLLHARNGIVVAARSGDTLTFYTTGPDRTGPDRAGPPGDSIATSREREALRRRVGAAFIEVVDINAVGNPTIDGFYIINDSPREVALRRLSVILSASRQRSLARVMLDGERRLLVPLGMELERGVALIYDGEWRRME